MKKSNKSKFILGALFGALAGVLFAPKSGKETREALKIKAEDLISKAKEIDIIEVRDTITSKTTEIIEEMKGLNKEKALKIAKKKASELKKHAEDLVSYTKEKATPKIEKAASELKEKTIEMTKKVLEKLEEE